MEEKEIIAIIEEAMWAFNKSMPGLPRVQADEWFYKHGEEPDFDFPVSPKLMPYYPFSLNNTVIAFYNKETANDVYMDFCGKYFTRRIKDRPDKVLQTVSETKHAAAMAFVGQEKNGIMIRSDLELPYERWYKIVLHELAHIFCIRTEMQDEPHFIDIYLLCTPEETAKQDRCLDGVISAGYEIWREFVADFISYSICGIESFSLSQAATNIKRALKEYSVFIDNPKVAKEIASDVILDFMLSGDVIKYMHKTDPDEIDAVWSKVKAKLQKLSLFPSLDADSNPFALLRYQGRQEHLLGMFELVFKHIIGCPNNRFEWNITKDFIIELGSEYIQFKAVMASL